MEPVTFLGWVLAQALAVLVLGFLGVALLIRLFGLLHLSHSEQESEDQETEDRASEIDSLKRGVVEEADVHQLQSDEVEVGQKIPVKELGTFERRTRASQVFVFNGRPEVPRPESTLGKAMAELMAWSSTNYVFLCSPDLKKEEIAGARARLQDLEKRARDIARKELAWEGTDTEDQSYCRLYYLKESWDRNPYIFYRGKQTQPGSDEIYTIGLEGLKASPIADSYRVMPRTSAQNMFTLFLRRVDRERKGVLSSGEDIRGPRKEVEQLLAEVSSNGD